METEHLASAFRHRFQFRTARQGTSFRRFADGGGFRAVTVLHHGRGQAQEPRFRSVVEREDVRQFDLAFCQGARLVEDDHGRLVKVAQDGAVPQQDFVGRRFSRRGKGRSRRGQKEACRAGDDQQGRDDLPQGKTVAPRKEEAQEGDDGQQNGSAEQDQGRAVAEGRQGDFAPPVQGVGAEGGRQADAAVQEEQGRQHFVGNAAHHLHCREKAHEEGRRRADREQHFRRRNPLQDILSGKPVELAARCRNGQEQDQLYQAPDIAAVIGGRQGEERHGNAPRHQQAGHFRPDRHHEQGDQEPDGPLETAQFAGDGAAFFAVPRTRLRRRPHCCGRFFGLRRRRGGHLFFFW